MNKHRISIIGAGVAGFALALVLQPFYVQAQNADHVKDSPVYSGVLVKDGSDGRVYRITTEHGQLVTSPK